MLHKRIIKTRKVHNIHRVAENGAKKTIFGTCLTTNEYKGLAKYANEKAVKLEGFRNFVGSPDVIYEVIDSIEIVAKDFPKICNNDKHNIVLKLKYMTQDKDVTFATQL